MWLSTQRNPIARRAFVQDSALILATAGLPLRSLAATEQTVAVRLGLVTDLHYADKDDAGTRCYRETLDKLQEAAQHFKDYRPHHVVELGDLIDAADSVDAEKQYLRTIYKQFALLPGQKHCVLGNHCVYTLTKKEFLEGVEQKTSYYSFDTAGFHFVVLDACFRSDGEPYGRKNFQWTDSNIPQTQLDWLRADLAATNAKTIVFVHQRLDVDNHYGIKNASAVRDVLERSGKVLSVFQGHSHQNDLNEINGIHYCVLRAMVEGSGAENSGFATMDVHSDGSLRIAGFRKQKSYSEV